MTRKIVKIISIVCLTAILCAIVCGVIVFSKWKSSNDYIKFDKKRLNEVYTSLTILDSNGTQIAEPLYLNNYKQVPLDALHDYTYKAFICIEDKRFFEHNGIDYKRVAGAAIHNLKSGGYKEGASTISQQLIKNTHLNNNKTLSRKVNEMLLARELEKNYSKHDILEMYLNTIYFGRHAYGIETASNVYFNKSAKDLTLDESAILAGMIKAPNTYAPDKNADKCISRRNSVLKTMLDQNAISNTQYEEATAAEITYCPQKTNLDKSYSYHVMNEACQLLNMTPMQLAQSNFVIETYCDFTVQNYLQNLIKKDDTIDKNGKLADISGVVTNNDGGVIACYFRGESGTMPRQAGSALKPIAVYAPALNERIITPASPVLDEETDFNGYKPTNLGGYNGWTTIKNSVIKSLNVPAVKTLNALTLQKSQQYLEKMGISGEQNLSLALGNTANGINTLELAECYETLAKNGVNSDLKFIKNIYSENGLVYSRKNTSTQVFQSAANYLMTDILIETVKQGTAKKLYSPSYQIAAKTGTVGNSNGNSDAIIAGYTTQNTFIIWYSGDFDNNVSGSNAPCSLAKSLLNNIYSEKVPDKFIQPKNVIELDLDSKSLHENQKMLICEDGEKYLFDAANQPKERLQSICYNYKIDVNAEKNNIMLTLPIIEKGEWNLYKIVNGSKQILTLDKNKYNETIDVNTEYYAELNIDGKDVYTTPIVKVYKTDDEGTEPLPPSILDYWYLK